MHNEGKEGVVTVFSNYYTCPGKKYFLFTAVTMYLHNF